VAPGVWSIQRSESLSPTHLEKDEEYLLELPEYVEVSELHVNDWLVSPDERP
jgi:hypothetical protein